MLRFCKWKDFKEVNALFSGTGALAPEAQMQRCRRIALHCITDASVERIIQSRRFDETFCSDLCH